MITLKYMIRACTNTEEKFSEKNIVCNDVAL